MSMIAQFLANRQNAKLSTGPRTSDGKAASSQNATQHGLCARGLIILPGQQEAFDKLESELKQSLVPVGGLQELIFKRILTAAWNLHRCEQAEYEIYRLDKQLNRDPLLGNSFECLTRVHRYAREAENSMYKGMRELAKLQTEAEFRCQDAQSQVEEEPISELCSVRQVRKATVSKPTPRNEAKVVAIPAAARAVAVNRNEPNPAPQASAAAA